MNRNETPLRVLLIMAGFAVEGPLGGIERMTIALAQALAALEPQPGCRPVQPAVCGLWRFGTPSEVERVAALNAQGIPAFIAYPDRLYTDGSPYAAWAAAWRALSRRAGSTAGRADVVHSQTPFGDPLALLVKRQRGARAAVRTVHDDVEWRKRPLRRIVLTQGLYPPGFDAEIAVADQIAARLDARPAARLLRRRARPIYAAIDTARVQAGSALTADERLAVRAALGIAPDAPLVLAAGRLVEQKGYDLLIATAARVRQALPAVRFLVAGEGEQRPALEAQRAALGLDDTVLLPGGRNDVERLLAAADLFVNSSRWEGLPAAVMEAMFAGTPVVAVDLPGNRHLLGEDERGLLAPNGDPDALAAAILRALATPRADWATRLAAAREYVAANLSITAVARQHAALYNGLVRG